MRSVTANFIAAWCVAPFLANFPVWTLWV